MGFWGVKIAVRTAHPIEALTAIAQLGGEEDGSWVETSGWTIASRHQADPPTTGLVSALAEQAGGPALVAYVVDSDVVTGYGARPGIAAFASVLNPELAPAYELSSTPEERAMDAVDLVGLVPETADPSAVTAVLGQNWTFAEDAFLALLAALGAFDRRRLEELVFGPIPGETND